MKINLAKHIKKISPFKEGLERFSRLGKSRGFGIQSPWAYSFVTEVINEKLPYYAYRQIEQTYPRKEQKWQKLFLRVRNFTYPYPTVIIDDTATLTDEQLTQGINKATSKGCIILRGINDSTEAQQRFESIKQRTDIGITFDLYHIAIIFLDTTIYKQHYKLNF